MKRVVLPLAVAVIAITAALVLQPRPAPAQPSAAHASPITPALVLDEALISAEALAEVEWQADADTGWLGEGVEQFNVARFRSASAPLSGPPAFTPADEWVGTIGAVDDVTAGGRYKAESDAVVAFIEGLGKLDFKKVSDTQNRELAALPHPSLRVTVVPVEGTEPLGNQMAANVRNVLYQVFKQRREPEIDMIFATLGRYIGNVSPATLAAAIDAANEQHDGDIDVIADPQAPSTVEMTVGGVTRQVSALSCGLSAADLDARAAAARETAGSAIANGAAITAARTAYIETLQAKQRMREDSAEFATATRNAARLRALWKAELFQAIVIEVIESDALGTGVRTAKPWVLAITTAGGARPTLFGAPDNVVERLTLKAEDVLQLPRIMTPDEKPEAKIVAGENPIVVMRTTMGEIRMELWEDEMPNTVANLIELIEADYYDGLRFHRVIDGFMVQGGCPTTREGVGPRAGTGDAGYKFRDEGNDGRLFDRKGLLAMANSGPNTNGSQFFITLVSTPHLNDAPGRHYSMFGEVVEGQDVVDAIGKVATNQRDQPLEEIIILGMWVEQKRDHGYEVERIR